MTTRESRWVAWAIAHLGGSRRALYHRLKCVTLLLLTATWLLSPHGAYGQTFVVQDDAHGIAWFDPAQADVPLLVGGDGVLENDTLDGSPVAALGAIAQLVQGPAHGSLSCASDATLQLCADGSFGYRPDSTYNGEDSFSYRVQYGSALSATASVTLRACSGGPTRYTCWKEHAYLLKLAELGYVSFSEGFEGSAWASAREPVSVVSVTSMGISWRSNYPLSNGITTGSGAARTGGYGLYDPDHGSATGTVLECDVDTPPEHCLYHDGVSGSDVSDATIFGVGGFFSGTYGSNLAVVLNGGPPLGLGRLVRAGDEFFGVIDTASAGIASFQFREMDGKVGQQRILFADDFTLALNALPGNAAPVANAGADQTVVVGSTVTLNGSGSSDIDGNALSYSWSLSSRPAGSVAQLTTPTTMMPGFVVDVAGSYTVQLIVNDGQLNSAPDAVIISTTNSAPVANAGMDQTAAVGSTVTLDGSGSSDIDGDALSYSWSLSSRPAGSVAQLTTPTSMMPGFVVDVAGSYTVQLIVNDGQLNSAADTVTISTGNSAPVANAGADQTSAVGSTVNLDGSGSSDIDGDALSYSWSLSSRPAGSLAQLTTPTSMMPGFVVDVAGSYAVQLIVNDGQLNSAPDTVTITTGNSAPVAEAGWGQVVTVGATVQLNGSGSLDVDGDTLSYRWSLLSRPEGSAAVLSSTASVTPSFRADLAGSYTVQLIVSDGLHDSLPDSLVVAASAANPPAGDVNPPPAAQSHSGGGGGLGYLVLLLGGLVARHRLRPRYGKSLSMAVWLTDSRK